jgi:tellurite resistance protein TehA-like permease
MSDRLRQEISELDPGYGAWVMATGIVSTGLALFGRRMLSDVLLLVACVALAVLAVAYAWRFVAFRSRLLADARDPSKAFGYLSLVAALDVVAVRFALSGRPSVTLVLGAASVPLLVALTYGILGVMVVGRRGGPVMPGVSGNWFLLVVAIQALSATASTVAISDADLAPSAIPVAVALWGIGVILYLMLAGLITVHLLELPVAPHTFSPTYWIYMGATAIGVLAAARILALPSSAPVVAATREVVSGLGFLLWAFGTWWIPLLLGFSVWRHGLFRRHLHYEAAWWSVVFPLGMYAVAGASYGRVSGLGFMVDIGRVEVWLGFVTWLAVSAAMVGSFLPGGPPSGPRPEPRPPRSPRC